MMFPLFMVGRVVWKAPPFFRRAWRAALIVTSLWAATIVLLASVFLSITLLIVASPAAIPILIVIHICLVTLFLVSALRWAADPLGPFHSFLTLIEHAQRRVETTTLFRNASGEDSAKQRQNGLEILGYFEKAFEWVMGKVNHMVKRTIVPLFSSVLIGVFLFTVTQYGIAIYALQNAHKDAFTKLAPDLYTCWIYSLTVIATSPIADVVPSIPMAYCV
jgi:CBS domain containing-hemolysin-like protein